MLVSNVVMFACGKLLDFYIGLLICIYYQCKNVGSDLMCVFI